MSQTTRILVFMIMGVAVGALLNSVISNNWLSSDDSRWIQAVVIDGLFDVVGQIFIASLQLMVVPLVLASLVTGVTSLGDATKIGTIAAKSITLYLFTTALAISLALVVGVILRPGEGAGFSTSDALSVSAPPPLKETIIDMFPSNPFMAMAEGNMLQVIMFALLLGVAISKSGKQGESLASFFEDLTNVILKMVTILLQLAPYGVFCLLAKIFSNQGSDAFLGLGQYFFSVVFALLLHCFFVYSFLLFIFTRLDPRIFFRKLRSAQSFGFSTSSSSASLPVTLRTVERRLGCPNSIASFTVPLGATINMDGTAIMQGVATAFIAQSFGVDLGVGDYLVVIVTATMASIGTAGVPGAGMVMLAMVLQQVGLPLEGIALILGVDRLLDMMRTAVNITGDAAISTIIAASEGKLDFTKYNDRSAGEI